MTEKKSSSPLVWFLLAAIVLGFMVIRLTQRGGGPSGVEHPAVDTPLPVLSVRPLTTTALPTSGTDLDLQTLRGRVVLLNLWGPWCPPCRQELPELATLNDRFRSNANFRLIAISYPNAATDIKMLQDDTQQCLEELDVAIDTFVDNESITSDAVSAVLKQRSHAFPTTMVLDQQGVVRGVWVGYAPQTIREMSVLIEQLLNPPAPAEPAAEPST